MISSRFLNVLSLFVMIGGVSLIVLSTPVLATSNNPLQSAQSTFQGAASAAGNAASAAQGAVTQAQNVINNPTAVLSGGAAELAKKFNITPDSLPDGLSGFVNEKQLTGALKDALGPLGSGVDISTFNLPSLPNIDLGGLGGQLGQFGNLGGLQGLTGIPDVTSIANLGISGLDTVAGSGCYKGSPGYCKTNTATNIWWGQKPRFSDSMQNYLLNDIYRDRIVKDWWETKFQPALKKMGAQMIASGVQDAGGMGGMMDGISANRAILASQTLQAGAYKNYTPGEGLCRFGTNMRSLAASDMGRIRTQVALATMGQARQLGTKGGSAESGPILDRQARLDQFKRLYCDPADNNGQLAAICGTSATTTPKRFNKDINITRTLLTPKTLNINFADGVVTADEEDVIALASNLYGPDVLPRETEFSFSDANSPKKLDYLSLRQLIAYRNVAQNSFNVAVAARGAGAPGTNIYMENILRELGMSPVEAKLYLSNNTNTPSYNAQMEILTKKIYQNPNFYTNLMDKPANVDRQIAALDAIGLMQTRDMYQSFERQELLLSLLLEMKTRTVQRDVDRNLKIVGR